MLPSLTNTPLFHKLILLTGYPCSGLTHRARQLAKLLQDLQDSLPQKPRYKIQIVGSHDAAHPRTTYDAGKAEKQARAVVYARVKRALSKDTIVICDGMNYIKGWRYQVWCEGKAAATTSCVVHVGTPIGQCVANNEARLRKREQKQAESDNKGEEAEKPETGDVEQRRNPAEDDGEEPYPPDLLQNLIFRYEEPSTMSRWDKPLFTVPWEDPTPPVEDIWTALTGIPIPKTPLTKEDATQSTPTTTASSETTSTANTTTTITPSTTLRTPISRPKIIPHQATQLPPTTDPSALHALEKRTSEIISALRTFTLSHPSTSLSDDDNSATGLSIPVPSSNTPVFIPASTLAASPTDELAGAGGILALPRLQRLRRQWVGMNRVYLGGGGGRSREGISAGQSGDAFVRFLNAEFEGLNA
ncbi:hypothetical protein AJ80_02858 [Polytolypa hystricis UAMH7299]|uniref:RNA polymerase II Elongator complex associated protein Kti12 n=1 Tax=Polytolypa hystricis (strain UAMH7299) TaxID=1447883 RepID=A0A2B7YG76_POLH7|nr:hypothetical protein AJ80_02858 [Polytolypa hystricis UAMH7299]